MFEGWPRGGVGWALAVGSVVATLPQIKRKLLAVGRVLQVLAKVADLRMGGRVDADEHHLPGNPLAPHLKAEHRRNGHGWCHAGNLVAGGPLNLFHVPDGIFKP
jgi:hypothetical protein